MKSNLSTLSWCAQNSSMRPVLFWRMNGEYLRRQRQQQRKKSRHKKKMAWTNVSTAKHVGTARVLHRGGCNVVPVVLVCLSSGRCFRLLCGYGVRFEGNGQMGERHHHHRHHPEIKRRKSEWPFRGGTQMRTFHGKYWGKQRYLQRSRRR